MAGLVIWAVLASAAAFILLYRLGRCKKEVERFTEQLEQWLDDIISEEEIEEIEEDEETIQSKIYEKLRRITYIFRRKKEEGLREKDAMQEMISDISHQTRTPIANMRVYLDILKEEPMSDKGKDFVRSLEGQNNKLNFLLQSLLKMSRMEAGLIKIQREETPLLTTIGKAVEAIVPEAEKKQIQLMVQCSEEIQISHDRKWTEEAIFNILDNAVKYTGTGGKIEIEVSVLEIYTRIRIRDNGKGIAWERQAQIFNRFYREPEVHEQEGIGIGLYLARRIIELQNGYIEVRSRVNQGSDFQIYLMNESLSQSSQ